jgi:hypothetical protein
MVFLQYPDMEDIMNAGARGQLQTVSNRINFSEDLERPIVFGCQFAFYACSEECRWVVLQTEPSPLPNIKGKGPMLVIIVMLVLLCCLKETLTYVY